MEKIPLRGWMLGAGAEPASYVPIVGPMTVAAVLRMRGDWSFEQPRNFDDETWWFKAELPAIVPGDVLRLEGLATLAEVFIDGRSVLSSTNMYHAHIVELPPGAQALSIRFDPLTTALAAKRPRPRWKTRLTSHQQLRWIRTSFLGRMPGWSPPVAPVGPWRDVFVERWARQPGTDTDRDIARYLHNASALAAEPPRVAPTLIEEPAPARVGLLTGTLPSLQSTGSTPALDAAESGEIHTVRELAPPSAVRVAAAAPSRASQPLTDPSASANMREANQSTSTLRGFSPRAAPTLKGFASAADAVTELGTPATLILPSEAAVPSSDPAIPEGTAESPALPKSEAAPEPAVSENPALPKADPAPPAVHSAEWLVPASLPSFPLPASEAPIPPAPITSSPVTGRLPIGAPAALDIRTSVEGTRGVVVISSPFEGIFSIAGQRVVLVRAGDRFAARLEIPDVELWWPHTHGAPHRYAARLDSAYGTTELQLAFRAVTLDTADGRFKLCINGTPIFCRGAVWTSVDVVTLTSTAAEYARVLGLVKDAGMNMLRISGTLFYEDDAFYEACDALGILVWQDFMFANMDYPIGDDAFRASVEREARQFLHRITRRPCVALLCGGSEVEQQSAMFGADRAIWRSTLFSEVLPAIVTEIRPDIPYWPSSPAGGALPFHVNEGVAHYYGVGAYLRPFEDARRANISFAAECLAFANIPEDDLFPIILSDGAAPFVSARWKERSSKDFGASWDFEDVRDHYVGRLFGVEPARVRYEDVERYIRLGRVATGETMHRVLAELRRANSTTWGALLWFLHDLWPGAGWGILDSRGEPKSAYWYCRRAMAPRTVFFTDEGANGLYVHVVNDLATPLAATLEVALYRDGETRTNAGARDLLVPPRTTLAVAADSLFERFTDSAYAYRFGPPGHDVAIASLRIGEELIDAAWLTDFAKPPAGAGLEGTLTSTHVTVTTRRFAQAVKIAVPGYSPADNYFDLAPGRTRTIPLRAIPNAKKRSILTGEIEALNIRSAISLKVEAG